MVEKKCQIIELGKDYEPFIRLSDETGEHLVPVRLRGDQENLTPAWRGHEVNNLGWFEIKRFDNSVPIRALLADHNEEECARCALWFEAENHGALLVEAPTEDWAALAEQIQAFYSTYIARWADDPTPFDPKMSSTLLREHDDNSLLYRWLEAAKAYVEARMETIKIVEDHLSLTRSSLQYLSVFGVFKAHESEGGPIFVHDGITWRVAADGSTERLTEVRDSSLGLAVMSWVIDSKGRELPGWRDARNRVLTMKSECAQTPGQRRAIPREFDMERRERRIAERTLALREKASELRIRVSGLTRLIRGL